MWVDLVKLGVGAFRRSVERDHGGYDEKCLEWISEDVNLTLSIQKVRAGCV